MSYIRKDGASADFNFEGGEYSRPLGDGANFGGGSLQAAIPAGFDLAIIGEHSVRRSYDVVSPHGLDFLGVGWNTVRDTAVYVRPYGLAVYFLLLGPYTRPSGTSANFGGVPSTPTIYPSGYDGAAFGGLNIRNYSARLLAGAIPPANKYGGASIWLYTRYLLPPGAHTQSFGGQWASHFLRHLEAVGAGDNTARGTPWVSHSPREIAAPGFDAMKVLESHVVGGTRYLVPVGTEMTQWGTRIIPEGQVAYPLGFAGEAGKPDVQLHTRYLRPQTFQTNPDGLRFGRQDVWNLRQIVQQDYDPADGLNPPPFGQWTGIENRNKEPVPVGWLSGRIGYQFVWNKASPVAPTGIESPPTEAGSVTHWRRVVAPGGIDSLASERWHTTYNKADVLRAQGASHQDFGPPALENRSRLYDKVGNFDSMAMGAPMVADRVRGLRVEERHTIEPPQINLPTVKLHTRYVEYVSAGDKFGVGSPVLDIRWTIISPRWPFHPPAWIGEPALRNVTPELRTGGANHEEFGTPGVRTQWRRVETKDGDMVQWGRPTVRDRRHWVEFVTVGAPPNLMPGPKVTKVGGLPEAQPIAPHSIPPGMVVPKPQLSLLFAYPAGIDSAKFGTPTVVANSIIVEPGYGAYLMGSPSVTSRRRELRVGAFGDSLVFQPSKPSLSPHTIYAVMEAPAQAVLNHPPVANMHYVGYGGYDAKGVGYHSISNSFRSIRPSGFATADSTRWPSPSVENARRYIRPDGVNSFRRGIPLIPGVQEVTVLDQGHYTGFGDTSVGRPPYVGPVTISPYGAAPPTPPYAVVDFYHRNVKPAGVNSLGVGASSDRDAPYQWASLHVGPPMPTIPEGFVGEQFGVASVSLAVRDVSVQGWDSFASEYNIDDFEQRMRVSKTPRRAPATTISAQGVAPCAEGVHDVRLSTHYIRPDGNADVYRKGAPQ